MKLRPEYENVETTVGPVLTVPSSMFMFSRNFVDFVFICGLCSLKYILFPPIFSVPLTLESNQNFIIFPFFSCIPFSFHFLCQFLSETLVSFYCLFFSPLSLQVSFLTSEDLALPFLFHYFPALPHVRPML